MAKELKIKLKMPEWARFVTKNSAGEVFCFQNRPGATINRVGELIYTSSSGNVDLLVDDFGNHLDLDFVELD